MPRWGNQGSEWQGPRYGPGPWPPSWAKPCLPRWTGHYFMWSDDWLSRRGPLPARDQGYSPKPPSTLHLPPLPQSHCTHMSVKGRGLLRASRESSLNKGSPTPGHLEIAHFRPGGSIAFCSAMIKHPSMGPRPQEGEEGSAAPKAPSQGSPPSHNSHILGTETLPESLSGSPSPGHSCSLCGPSCAVPTSCAGLPSQMCQFSEAGDAPPHLAVPAAATHPIPNPGHWPS